MHAQHQRGALDRAELVAEIIGAERRERKFVFGRAFPQEIQIDVLRDGVGLLHQLGRAAGFSNSISTSFARTFARRPPGNST